MPAAPARGGWTTFPGSLWRFREPRARAAEEGRQLNPNPGRAPVPAEALAGPRQAPPASRHVPPDRPRPSAAGPSLAVPSAAAQACPRAAPSTSQLPLPCSGGASDRGVPPPTPPPPDCPPASGGFTGVAGRCEVPAHSPGAFLRASGARCCVSTSHSHFHSWDAAMGYGARRR